MTIAKKLTPDILKQLIKEEKAKLSSLNQKTSIGNELAEFVKLTLEEAKILAKARKIRTRRKEIKNNLKRR